MFTCAFTKAYGGLGFLFVNIFSVAKGKVGGEWEWEKEPGSGQGGGRLEVDCSGGRGYFSLQHQPIKYVISVSYTA